MYVYLVKYGLNYFSQITLEKYFDIFHTSLVIQKSNDFH